MRPARRARRFVGAWLCGLLCAIAAPQAGRAGSARDYLNAPVDTWLTLYNTGYFTSVTPEDGMDLLSNRTDTDVVAQSVVVTRIIDVGGRTSGISAILPYNIINVNSDAFSASRNGVSDVGFMLQTNIFGGPALSRAEFRDFVPETFSSFHLIVTTPLGQYQATNPLNPSANRWMINPTINYSYTPDQGWTWLELYMAARIFTANTNYRVGGASSLRQAPLYLLEGHASRNLTDRLWLSADAYYSNGGETRIDGVAQHNAADTLALGAGLGVSVGAGIDLMLNYEGVVAKPGGQPDAQAITMTLRRFW